MRFAPGMENEVAAADKPIKPQTPAMTGITIAYLLAPSILFVCMAWLALTNATYFGGLPQDKRVVERHRTDNETIQLAAAKIAAGNPLPSREVMLESLLVREKRIKAWEEILVDCASAMKRVAIGVLIGVVCQIYVILRLRSHYKKLTNRAIG
jgi:hypothetical protein